VGELLVSRFLSTIQGEQVVYDPLAGLDIPLWESIFRA